MGNLISVRVKYFAAIREITGKKEDVFALRDGTSAQDILQLLRDTYGERLASRVLDEHGRLRRGFGLLVNGEETEDLDHLRLKDGDIVVILPPIAGGQG